MSIHSYNSSSEEEEDQWCLAEMCVLNEYTDIIYREPCRDSIFTGPMWVKELLNGHSDRIYDEFRMERHVFENLCSLMTTRGWLDDSRYLKVDEQIGMFLQVLQAKGGIRRIAERFQHSNETVSRFFKIVLQAFLEMGKEFIQPPSFDVIPKKIKQDPKFFPYFKDCVGAIDGTHISAVVPKDKQIRYRNRKGSTTQNVMCACNFDMEFTFVYAGWEGSANDCRVFQRALQKESLHFPMPPIGKYYIVDSGYPTQRGFLTPFRGERYHLQDYQGEGRQPRTAKELFNRRHAYLRNVIERVFGVIKARFPILKTMSPYPLELQPRIVMLVVHCTISLSTIKEEINGLQEPKLEIMMD